MRLWRQLAWDSWRLVGCADKDLSVDDLGLLDRAAALSATPDASFAEFGVLYESESDLRPSERILSYE